MNLQQKIISEMGVKPVIDPAEEVRKRLDFLKDYLLKTKTKGYVLGISGGLDSTLAGRLAQLAVEELNEAGIEADFIAVRLPYARQQDEADAAAAMEFINAKTQLSFNIGAATDALKQEFYTATGVQISDFNNGNVKARLRMVAQYALAGQKNLLVIGTDHGAESSVGFFTKFGDGGADILPLYGLNKRQNRLLLKFLGAPAELYEKIPTADLLDETPLRADEDELGVSYEEIDDYLEGKAVRAEAKAIIEQKHYYSRHKRTTPATIFDQWWKE